MFALWPLPWWWWTMAVSAGLHALDLGGLWLPPVAVPSVLVGAAGSGQSVAPTWLPCHIGPRVPAASPDTGPCKFCGRLPVTFTHSGGVCADCWRHGDWLRGQARRRAAMGARAVAHMARAARARDAVNVAAASDPTPDTLTVWVDGNYAQLDKARKRRPVVVAPMAWQRGRVVGLSGKSRKAIMRTVSQLDTRALPLFVTLTWPRVWPAQLAAQSALDALLAGLRHVSTFPGLCGDAWYDLRRCARTLDVIYAPPLRAAGVAVGQLSDADYLALTDALTTLARVALTWSAPDAAAAAVAVTAAGAALRAIDAVTVARRAAWATVRKFYKRTLRAFPDVSLVWRLQPQRRGAPHYHLLAYGLRGDGDAAGVKFSQWAAQQWTDCVTATMPGALDARAVSDHLRHGCRVDVVTGQAGVKRYLAAYVSRSDASGPLAIAGRQWGKLGAPRLPVSATVTVAVATDTSKQLVRGIRRMATRALTLRSGRVVKYVPGWRTTLGAGWRTDCPGAWLAYGSGVARGSYAAMLARAAAALSADGVTAVDGDADYMGVLSDVWQQATDGHARVHSPRATSTAAARSRLPRGPTD